MNAVPESIDFRRPPPPIVRRRLAGHPDFTYLAWLGPDPDPDRFLVLVHGISRQADFMMRAFVNLAEKDNYSLLAPEYNYRTYSDYQRLGREGLGERADEAFLGMLADAGDLLGMGSGFDLFGFSGGAQFAHRFAYAYPGRARTLSLAAAGWYTAPDERRRYPYGLKSTKRLPGLTFSADGVTDVPTLTIVGENDTARDTNLRKRQRVDTVQGRHRVARARWFHRAILEAAERSGKYGLHEYLELPATGHDFATAAHTGGLVNEVFSFIERAKRQNIQENAR